jgi:tetratricopeptide (TPR) repeat protein
MFCDMPTELPPQVSPGSPLGQFLIRAGDLIEKGEFAQAIEPMREAAALVPNNGRIQTDLGGLYLELGHIPEALEHLCRAIEINPKIALAHWRLGVALHAMGNAEDALQALETAVQIRPSLADAHLRLGGLYRAQGRISDAARSYRTAAQLTESQGERQYIEALALIAEGRDNEAATQLKAALEAEPGLPSAHGILARILSASGLPGQASQHYKAQIERTPHAGLCYYDFARSQKITKADDDVLQRIDSILKDPNLDDNNRSLILLARGKAFDDLDRYGDSMNTLDEAAALRARTQPFDIEAFESQVEQLCRLFDAEMLSRTSGSSESTTPLLIVGTPLSGTKLVEKIVLSHPQVAGAGDLSFWRNRLEIALESASLSSPFLSAMASEYLDILRKTSNTAARVCDRDPSGFLAIGLVHMAFPRAAIVHCRRSPIDTAISIRQLHFSRSMSIPFGGEDLVRYFQAYQRMMEHWRRTLPQGRLCEIDYERISASPQTEIRRLIQCIGLPWDDACLTPHANTEVVKGARGMEIHQSIAPGSVGRWRRYEPWLGPLAALKPAASDQSNAGTSGELVRTSPRASLMGCSQGA